MLCPSRSGNNRPRSVRPAVIPGSGRWLKPWRSPKSRSQGDSVAELTDNLSFGTNAMGRVFGTLPHLVMSVTQLLPVRVRQRID